MQHGAHLTKTSYQDIAATLEPDTTALSEIHWRSLVRRRDVLQDLDGRLLVGARRPGLATRIQPICYSQFPVLGLAAQIVAGGRARVGVEAGDHPGAEQRIDLVVLVLVGAGDPRVTGMGVIFV